MADRRAEKLAAEIEKEVDERGWCTIPDVLIGIGMLSERKYEEWRKGNLFCLEDGCSASLSQLHSVLTAIKAHAEELGLKPSVNRYSVDGRPSIPLRFTKSGDVVRERLYSTHYLDPWRAQEIRRSRR